MAVTTETPLIGVVTVLYNSDDVLPDFFASLSVQTHLNFRLYVIDNGAKDTGSVLSRELSTQYNIDTEIVFNNANVGVARGNNQGIQMALDDGCEYVLLANNDIEFRNPTAVSNLLWRATAAGALASVPKIIYHGTNQIWCAGGWFSRLKGITPHIGYQLEDRGQFDEEMFTEYAPTCFMLLHKSVFDRVGLMDEKYFVYYDDSDFVWRMNDAKIQLLYVPTSCIAHKVAVSTGGKESPFTLYYTSRNRVYFSRKHLPFAHSTIAITYSIVGMAVRCVKFSPAARMSVFKGFKAGLTLSVTDPSVHRRVATADQAER
ncbi:glycosyltransferase family 2 protein [Caballeronia sp. LjRoot31]|jgi:GT2 family glycosyltransferase|uniref:glycosyltransferase family 2 protein n=1 Tax=Caballeronia sp. LjRoot31 TaxID=3342324 RepID=UPI003ECC9582